MKSGKKYFFFSFLAIFMSGEVDIITLKCFTSGAVYCSLAELENDLQNCRQCWTMWEYCCSNAALSRIDSEIQLGNVGQCLCNIAAFIQDSPQVEKKRHCPCGGIAAIMRHCPESTLKSNFAQANSWGKIRKNRHCPHGQ